MKFYFSFDEAKMGMNLNQIYQTKQCAMEVEENNLLKFNKEFSASQSFLRRYDLHYPKFEFKSRISIYPLLRV